MSAFQKVKIKDIAEINPDSIGSNFNYGIIEYVDISSVGIGNLTETREVSIQNAPSRAKRLVKSGDTILSTVRPNRRSFFYFKNPKENTLVSTGFAVLRALGTNDPRYLYYSVTGQSFTEYLTKNAKGSAYPAVDAGIIYDGEVFVPKNTEDQTRISSVLSTYDDLIENNEKRIKTLEEMSQLLYTEWIVKFKFPGRKKIKMIESGTEYGMIPEGWAVKKLKEIGKAVTGKTPPTSNFKNFGGEILFIKTPDIHGNIFVLETEQTLSIAGAKLQSLKLLPEKTVFVSCIGTLGVVGITSKPSQTNQQINALILNDHSDYCLFYFFAKSFKQKLIGLGSNGATMGNVNKDKFENINILYPEEKIRKLFFKATTNFFNEILLLQKRNSNLSKARDLLIPSLVTGKRELKFQEIKKLNSVKVVTSNLNPYQDAVIFALIARDLAKKYSRDPSRFEVQKNKYFIDRYLIYDVRSKYAAKVFGPYDTSSRYRGGESIAIKSGYVSLVNDTKFEIGKNISVAEKYYSKSLLRAESIFAFVRSKSDDELELLTTIDYAIFDIVSNFHKKVTAKDVLNYINIHPVWSKKIERLKLSEEKIERVMSVLKELAKLGINYPKA